MKWQSTSMHLVLSWYTGLEAIEMVPRLSAYKGVEGGGKEWKPKKFYRPLNRTIS